MGVEASFVYGILVIVGLALMAKLIWTFVSALEHGATMFDEEDSPGLYEEDE